MPFRLLVRAAPFVLGAVAFALWLRRRGETRPALPPAPPAEPPPPAPEPAPEPPVAAAPEPPAVDIVTVVDDLLGAPS